MSLCHGEIPPSSFHTMFFARFSIGPAMLLALAGVIATPMMAQVSVKAIPYSLRVSLEEDIPSYTLSSERLQTPVPQVYQKDDFRRGCGSYVHQVVRLAAHF